MAEKLSEIQKDLQRHIDMFGIPKDISLKPVYYYGYFQGFKVLIEGEKFPKERGAFYTTDIWEEALLSALEEYEKIKSMLEEKKHLK